MQRVNILFQYLSYKLFARHKHGHSIHSPLVYNMIKNVLNRYETKPVFNQIEELRKAYIRNGETISAGNYGAGSKRIRDRPVKIKDLIKTSAVSEKYGKMLHFFALWYQPGFIIELGTSLGISTAYLASAVPATKISTIEGNAKLAAIACKNFQNLKLENIEQVTGIFETELPEILKTVSGKLMVFIDGDHRYERLISYYTRISQYQSECFMIFDDIRWSEEMHIAWKKIISDNKIRISVDLFFMGIAVTGINVKKQHFVIKY